MKFIRLILFIGISFLYTGCEPEDLYPDLTDPREKITGVWVCNENSPTFQHQVYDVSIRKSELDSTRILVSNFFGLGAWVEAEAVVSGSQVVIPTQTLENFQVSGSGVISSGSQSITLQYIITEILTKKSRPKQILSESVTAEYSRK